MKKKNGFTLIELLATIAVLAIVLGLVTYVAIGLINSAREKSYVTTIKNVESNASNYLSENAGRLFFLSLGSDNNNEYQCITVRNLIDTGFLDNTVLDANVSKDRKVSSGDYIYIERDGKTRAIIKSVYIMDSKYTEICGVAITTEGDIKLDFGPNLKEYSREKNVTITYKLKNLNDITRLPDYDRGYSYDGTYTDGGYSGEYIKKIQITSNGTLQTWIKYTPDDKLLASKEEIIDTIDREGPKAKHNYSGNKSVKRTVIIPISIYDEKAGLKVESVDKEDFKIYIGSTAISNYSISEKNNTGEYEIKINSDSVAGKVTIKIEASQIEDILGNGNEEITLTPDVEFDNTYNVTLNKGTGTGAGTTSITATYGKAAISPSTITLASKKYKVSGFGLDASRKSDGATISSTNDLTSTATLNGYYTENSGGKKVLNANTSATWVAGVAYYTNSNGKWIGLEDKVLYAQFGSMPAVTLPTITKAGYTCGWTNTSTGTTIKYASGSSFTPTKNTTLYGVCEIYKVNIRFNVNGGTFNSTNTSLGVDSSGYITKNGNIYMQTISYGDFLGENGLANYNYAASINIERTGYTGKSGAEWNTKTDGTGTSYDQTVQYNDSDFCNASNSDCTVTLYVNWVANTYTINLNRGQGTSAGTESIKATYESSTINPSTITLASKEYTISGFDLDDSRNSTGATVSSKTTLKSKATLNGYYTAASNGIKVLSANTTATWVASVENYTDANRKWTKTSGTTLYAQYGSMPAVTLPTITKPGYTCGWTTSESGTTIIYASGGTLTPVGNTTLYGVCVAHQVKIKFNVNGGTFNSTSTSLGVDSSGYITKNGNTYMQVVPYGESLGENGLANYNYAASINILKKGYIGKSGAEWNTKTDGTGTSYDQTVQYQGSAFCNASNSDCTVTLYVNWEPKKYYVRYHGNGGSANGKDTWTSKDFVYNVEYTKMIEENWYNREGYKFVGWNTYADGSGVSSWTPGYPNGTPRIWGWDNEDYDIGIEEDNYLDLYAIWEKLPSATNPTLSNVSVTYDGSAHAIGVSGGSGGTIYYSTSTNNTSWGEWSTTKPSLTNVGTLYVKAYVVGDSSHASTTATAAKTITISQRAVTVTAPTMSTSTLTFNNGDQTITNKAGSCTTGGTMYYYTADYTTTSAPTFSKTDGKWSTTFPTVKGKDAKTYYLWYYCYVSDTTNNKAATDSSINTALKLTKAIGKYTPSITINSPAGSVVAGSTSSFTATPTTITGCVGTLTATSDATNKVSVSNASSGTYGTTASHNSAASGTAKTFYYKGVGATSGTNVTISYVPSSTTNCNSAATKTISITVTNPYVIFKGAKSDVYKTIKSCKVNSSGKISQSCYTDPYKVCQIYKTGANDTGSNIDPSGTFSTTANTTVYCKPGQSYALGYDWGCFKCPDSGSTYAKWYIVIGTMSVEDLLSDYRKDENCKTLLVRNSSITNDLDCKYNGNVIYYFQKIQ